MTTDFRALCAELADLLNRLHSVVWAEASPLLNEDSGGSAELDLAIEDALTSARAALAAPEQGPTDEALASFTAYFCRNYPGPDTIIHKPECHAPKIFRAAAWALARWGRPAVEPVPEEGEWW